MHFYRYGYGERVQQDENFADLVMQRVAMLQYGSLLDIVMKSPELQNSIPDLTTASMLLPPFISHLLQTSRMLVFEMPKVRRLYPVCRLAFTLILTEGYGFFCKYLCSKGREIFSSMLLLSFLSFPSSQQQVFRAFSGSLVRSFKADTA